MLIDKDSAELRTHLHDNTFTYINILVRLSYPTILFMYLSTRVLSYSFFFISYCVIVAFSCQNGFSRAISHRWKMRWEVHFNHKYQRYYRGFVEDVNSVNITSNSYTQKSTIFVISGLTLGNRYYRLSRSKKLLQIIHNAFIVISWLKQAIVINRSYFIF